jgi:hypothetical protein
MIPLRGRQACRTDFVVDAWRKSDEPRTGNARFLSPERGRRLAQKRGE